MGTRRDRLAQDSLKGKPCPLCGMGGGVYGPRGSKNLVQDLRDSLAHETLRVNDLHEELRQTRDTLRAVERQQQAERDAAINALSDAKREIRTHRAWVVGKAERQRKALNALHVAHEGLVAKLAEVRAANLALRLLIGEIAQEMGKSQSPEKAAAAINKLLADKHDTWGKPA